MIESLNNKNYLNTLVICNKVEEALFWESAGVDTIFIDLEVIGKQERQGHIDSVKSCHTMDDIVSIKKVLSKSNVLVRVNPIHEHTQAEIEKAIEYGADEIMLPMFKTIDEVKEVLSIINNRCALYPLIETPEAVLIAKELSETSGIHGFHFGLNDLHLALNKTFMFEVLYWKPFLDAIDVFQSENIYFGIGGVSKVGTGKLLADLIIREFFRLGSSRVILSRNFKENTKDVFDAKLEVDKVRHVYSTSSNFNLEKNLSQLKLQIKDIVKDAR